VGHGPERVERLFELLGLEGPAVPAVQVLDEGNALALERPGQDDRRQALLPHSRKRIQDLRDVMTVHGDGVPTEGPELAG
jgi:hypothetical protein